MLVGPIWIMYAGENTIFHAHNLIILTSKSYLNLLKTFTIIKVDIM